MRLGPRNFSRDCTEDSDMPLSGEMKDEPAFKPLQGNPTFFRVRESRYPLHLWEQIQVSIKHTEVPNMFDWEHGIALQPIQGIRSHLPPRRMLMGFLELWPEPGVYS